MTPLSVCLGLCMALLWAATSPTEYDIDIIDITLPLVQTGSSSYINEEAVQPITRRSLDGATLWTMGRL